LDALVSALISKENDMTNDTPQISRRALLKGATLTVGAAAFLKPR
jgi:hypothetical protein